MVNAQMLPDLISTGTRVDPENLGWLEDSSPLRDDRDALVARMNAQGYLFFRGLLSPDAVREARRSVCERLNEQGYLQEGSDPMDAVWNRDRIVKFKPEFANGNPQVQRLLYQGEMVDFFDHFLGQPVSHYDFTWLRAVCPGAGTPSHCDVVYMGRGERERLYTAWTPLGDIDFAQGGLMVLEGSHLFDPLKGTYGQHDVDSHCVDQPKDEGWKKAYSWIPGSELRGNGGHLGNDPNAIQRVVGGRWKTCEYQAGDLLIFTCYTVHASLDNQSDRIRLSTDSRYQPAGTVRDERWIGVNPIGHSDAGKRGKIC